MMRDSKGFRVFITAALAVAALSVAPAMAGPGNSGDNGGGNKGGNKGGNHGQVNAGGGQVLKAGNQGGQKRQSQGNGTLASELKKLNGAIHASFRAWTNASSNGVPGLARTYAGSTGALSTFEGDLTQLEADKQALLDEISYQEYQTMIDNLDPAGFDTPELYEEERAGLVALRDTARTDEEIALELDPIQQQLDDYEGNQTAAEDSLNRLTGGRELSDEAMGVFEARVEEYLASDEYLATVETEGDVLLVEEEAPVE